LVLKNFRCFENLDIKLHPNLAVIVGANGSGKTSIMEGAAIAVSTIFVKMDGLYSRRIDKNQVRLKAFRLEVQRMSSRNIRLRYRQRQ
jgi:putative ATP binding protein